MKLTEIAERLVSEFPGVYTALDITINSYPRKAEMEVTIYHEHHGQIACRTLDEGIAAMHLALNPKPPEIDVDLNDAGKIGDRKDGAA